MGELKATPQNPVLGALAKALRSGKDALNYPGKLPASWPLVGGMGAGDFVMGKGPELMEDMSYGSPPYRGKGQATVVDPRTLDLALLPGIGAAASALRSGAKAVPQSVSQASRRGFLESLGKGAVVAGAATAAPTTVVKALRAGASEAIPQLAKEIMPQAVEEVAPQVIVQAVKKAAWGPDTLRNLLVPLRKYVGPHHIDADLVEVPKVVKEYGPTIQQYLAPDEVQRVLSMENHSWSREYPEVVGENLGEALDGFSPSPEEAYTIATRPAEEWRHLMPEVSDESLEYVPQYLRESDLLDSVLDYNDGIKALMNGANELMGF